jgi:hypothetical protein
VRIGSSHVIDSFTSIILMTHRYANMQTAGPELEKMLLEYDNGKDETEGWPGPTFGPTTSQKLAQIGPTRPNLRNRRTS